MHDEKQYENSYWSFFGFFVNIFDRKKDNITFSKFNAIYYFVYSFCSIIYYEVLKY